MGAEVGEAEHPVQPSRAQQAPAEQEQQQVERLAKAETGAQDALDDEAVAEQVAQLGEAVVAVARVAALGGVERREGGEPVADGAVQIQGVERR